MNYDIDAMRKRLQEAAKRKPKPDTAKKAVAALHSELIVLREQGRGWKEIASELGDLWDGTPDTLRQLHVKEVRSGINNGSDAVPKVPKQRRVKSNVATAAPVTCPGGGAESHTGSDTASLMHSVSDIVHDGAAVAITLGGQPNPGPFALQRDIFGDEADA